MRLVRRLLYLLEIESSWKAHYEVKGAVSLECGSINFQSTTPGATWTPKTETTYHLPQQAGRISSQIESISAAELRAISGQTYPPLEG